MAHDYTIKILEDWNQDNDGYIWYRWKRVDENGSAEEGEWHSNLTAYKQKPAVQWKLLNDREYNQLLKGDPQDGGFELQPDGTVTSK